MILCCVGLRRARMFATANGKLIFLSNGSVLIMAWPTDHTTKVIMLRNPQLRNAIASDIHTAIVHGSAKRSMNIEIDTIWRWHYHPCQRYLRVTLISKVWIFKLEVDPLNAFEFYRGTLHLD